MKTTTVLGIIVLAVGMLALVYQGVAYTTSEEIVHIGPIQIVEQDTSTIPLPPIVGVIAVIAGAVLILSGNRDRRVRA